MRCWSFPQTHPAGRDEPWTDEPDKAQWVDESTGLDCLIVRAWHGALCGYVGVRPTHPLYGQPGRASVLAGFRTHARITYAALCEEGDGEEPRVCCVAESGRSANVWWFGFDCAHPFDVVPSRVALLGHIGLTYAARTGPAVYRRFGYVREQVTLLASQLAAVQRGRVGRFMWRMRLPRVISAWLASSPHKPLSNSRLATGSPVTPRRAVHWARPIVWVDRRIIQDQRQPLTVTPVCLAGADEARPAVAGHEMSQGACLVQPEQQPA